MHRDCFPFLKAHCLRDPFSLSWKQKRSTMSSKRNEYHVDGCAKRAAIFFVACKPNPATRVKISNAMRIRGTPQARPPIEPCKCRCIVRQKKLKQRRLFLALPLLQPWLCLLSLSVTAAASALLTADPLNHCKAGTLHKITESNICYRHSYSSVATQKNKKNISSEAD